MHGYTNAQYLRYKSRITQECARYRAAHREELAEKARAYNRKRFFWKTARNLALRCKGLSATFKELAQLWKEQRGTCPYTNRRLTQDTAQLDHCIPLIRGGSSTIENLKWVHRDVNYAKRDLSEGEFLRLCEEVAARKVLKVG